MTGSVRTDDRFSNDLSLFQSFLRLYLKLQLYIFQIQVRDVEVFLVVEDWLRASDFCCTCLVHGTMIATDLVTHINSCRERKMRQLKRCAVIM